MMHSAIRALLTQDSGDSDVWGWAIAHHFDIAATLYLRDESIPREWQYRPSPLMTEDVERSENLVTDDLLDMLDSNQITADDIRYAGQVMFRYCNWAQRAGKDY